MHSRDLEGPEQIEEWEREPRYTRSKYKFDRSCYMAENLGRSPRTINGSQCLRQIVPIRWQQRITNKDSG